MATRTKAAPRPQLSEDVTLTVRFRADGTVEIPLEEVLHRAGSSREAFDKTAKIDVIAHEDRAGLWVTDVDGAVAWIDAEHTRREEHRSRWQAYVDYREQKKQEAREARLEAARKAREQEREAQQRRWKKLTEEQAQKAQREAAQRASAEAELHGGPMPFESFSGRAS